MPDRKEDRSFLRALDAYTVEGCMDAAAMTDCGYRPSVIVKLGLVPNVNSTSAVAAAARAGFRIFRAEQEARRVARV